jgi:hypothetical protein
MVSVILVFRYSTFGSDWLLLSLPYDRDTFAWYMVPVVLELGEFLVVPVVLELGEYYYYFPTVHYYMCICFSLQYVRERLAFTFATVRSECVGK